MWPFWDEKAETYDVTKSKENETTTNVEKTLSETLECDYQRDCIPLYKHLEGERFDEAYTFLTTGYWPGCIFSDPIAPELQARTWITRFDESEHDKQVVWSQLALHLAIVVEAPISIVKKLVEFYPQSVRCTDDQRMLPLHLALRHGGNFEVVAFLLKQFPEAVNVRGGKGEGRLPVEYAQRGPNKALGDILETFVEKSKAKATKTAAKNHAKELEILQAKLQAKEYELSNVKNRLNTLDDEKDSLERELYEKRKELKESMESMERLSALKQKEEIEGAVNAEEKEEALTQSASFIEGRKGETAEDAPKPPKKESKKKPEAALRGTGGLITKHINALEEHQTGLRKRIEEIERKVQENKTESKVTEEEGGLLEELGSVLDQSIQQLRERVNTVPSMHTTEETAKEAPTPTDTPTDTVMTKEEITEDKQPEERPTTPAADLQQRIIDLEVDVALKRSESKINSELSATFQGLTEIGNNRKEQIVVETVETEDEDEGPVIITKETIEAPHMQPEAMTTEVERKKPVRRPSTTDIKSLMEQVRAVTKRPATPPTKESMSPTEMPTTEGEQKTNDDTTPDTPAAATDVTNDKGDVRDDTDAQQPEQSREDVVAHATRDDDEENDNTILVAEVRVGPDAQEKAPADVDANVATDDMDKETKREAVDAAETGDAVSTKDDPSVVSEVSATESKKSMFSPVSQKSKSPDPEGASATSSTKKKKKSSRPKFGFRNRKRQPQTVPTVPTA